MRNIPPIRYDHVYPCDSAGYQNELLCTNSQTEYTNCNGLDDVWAGWKSASWLQKSYKFLIKDN